MFGSNLIYLFGGQNIRLIFGYVDEFRRARPAAAGKRSNSIATLYSTCSEHEQAHMNSTD